MTNYRQDLCLLKHFRCFLTECFPLKQSLSSSFQFLLFPPSQVFVGFDNEIYCKVCYPKIEHTPLPADPTQTARIKADDGDGCPRCGGKVFEAEKMMSRTGVYHKRCFSCNACQKPIDYTNMVDHQREVYCRFVTTFHENLVTSFQDQSPSENYLCPI